jgi:hypothetical protein
MTQTQDQKQNTFEIQFDLYGETVTGTLTTAASGNSLDHLFEHLRASKQVDELQVRDAGSVVWTVLGSDE